jgi:hypothetical protein
MTNQDNHIRDKARKFLERGIASPSEVAVVADVSRQLVRYWSTDINWRKARENRLLRLWRAKRAQ